MAKRKATDVAKKLRPSLTPEGEENQLIALAVALAKKQLQEGTASSQVIAQCLKMGSTRERLERERLEEENNLLRAKINAINAGEDMKTLYEEAIKAMKDYSGHDDEDY